MAKLTRQILIQFGKDGSTTNFAQFGSLVAADPTKTKDIATIQGLSAWLNGWQSAIFGANKLPTLEDMNGLLYVSFYQLFYLLEQGIPEWQTGTTYYIGSYVKKVGTNELYTSITDGNVGNALPSAGSDNGNWINVYPVRTGQLVGSIINSQITSLDAGKITGQLTDAQIASLTASKITGQITDAQIQGVAASKISGTIGDAQISAVAASKITGTLNGATQIADNSIPNAKISAIDASKISGGPLALNVLNALTNLKFAGFDVLSILQIQMATTNTEAQISSSSFSNTNLTMSFTPKRSNSKILLLAFGAFTVNANDAGCATLARNGVNLAPTNGGFHAGPQANNFSLSMMTIDQPGTTSAFTYSVQIRTNGGAAILKFPTNLGGNIGVPAGVMIAIELGQP